MLFARPTPTSCPFGSVAASTCPRSRSRSSSRARTTRHQRRPTRETPSVHAATPPSEGGGTELLYLPPLLSLLPENAAPSASVSSSNNISYTLSRLPTVDAASIALHAALHDLKPTTPNYAHAPYEESFNWSKISLPAELQREWYIVAFRSTRAADSPSRDLYEADRLAHEEAVTAGGLLAYWYGTPDSTGSNLATCIWMSRAHAVKATSGPKHIEAMRLATAMYANYDLERYVLRKVQGETSISVEPWRGGEVSFE